MLLSNTLTTHAFKWGKQSQIYNFFIELLGVIEVKSVAPIQSICLEIKWLS